MDNGMDKVEDKSAYAGIVQAQRAFFATGATREVQGRIAVLRRLKQVIKQREGAILAALQQDLHKAELEAYMTEIGILYQEIDHVCKHLKRWAKPRRVKTAITHIGSKGLIYPEPYGTALIIAPWNYPFQLTFSPLIGALAAGNTAVLKPSEYTPSVTAEIVAIIREAFPPEYVTVVEGAAEAAAGLLKERYDTIFFTGSVPVGKIVMEAAARHLTPVTLELGGKSPCIVHRDADLKLAALRIAFGKFTNAGQTCIAPDYLLVHRDMKQPLVEELRRVIRRFYGDNPLESPRYGRIVSKRHYERLTGFLQDGEVLLGGEYDSERLRLAPTLLDRVSPDAPVMQEEIFGPILPVLEYDSIEEAIAFVTARQKPLALYLFTPDKRVQEQVLAQVSFGGGCINDTLMHIATPHLPFGGVGESGMGSYHGRQSFTAFSHEKSVLKQTTKWDLSFRYPSAVNGLTIVRRFMK